MILEDDKPAGIDGYLVYQMNCWNRVVQTMATSDKPVLYADFQYGGSGGFLVYTAAFLRSQTPNVGFAASSRSGNWKLVNGNYELPITNYPPQSVSDFVAATARVRMVRTPKPGDLACKPDGLKTLSPQECIRRMKESRILAVRGQESGAAEPIMGIPMEHVSFAEVNEAWKAADKDEARAVADRYTRPTGLHLGSRHRHAKFGCGGRANPFEILTHSEDRQGASVRSILPLGYMTTTLEIAQERNQIILERVICDW